MFLDYHQEVEFFHQQGTEWCLKFEKSQKMHDLDMFTMFAQKALDSTTAFQNHPSRPILFSTLSTCFVQRFERTGCLRALNEALRYLEVAYATASKNDPQRSGILNNFGNALGKHFERTQKRESLDRAINVATEAVRTARRGDNQRPSYISNLIGWVSLRYGLTGSVEDLNLLNHGITLMRSILHKGAAKEKDVPFLMKSIGDHLQKRHRETGSLDDLNEAIDLHAKAADLVVIDHAFKAKTMDTLGVLLRERFEMTGSTDDIIRSVSALRYALDSCPLDSPRRPNVLLNLANSLGKRSARVPCSQARPERKRPVKGWGRTSERIACIHDLDDAIDAASESVQATNDGDPGKAGRLYTLSLWLAKRGSSDIPVSGDLDRALETVFEALNGYSNGQCPHMFYHHAGVCFWHRSKRDNSVDDISSAIKYSSLAVGSVRDGHPIKSLLLRNLGLWQRFRWEMTGSHDDLEDAISTSRDGFESGHGSPMIRMATAREVAELAIFKDDWKLASEYYQKAVHLLSELGPRSLKHSDVQVELTRFAGIATMATSAALNAGEDLLHSLQILESGRGHIANMLMDTRHDISELESKHRELARKFVTLRERLDSATAQTPPPVAVPIEDFSSPETTSKQQREAEKEFRALIDRIRTEPGFQNFLMPPALRDLKAVAQDGTIVVINMSKYRSDAFLIDRESIRLVKLPDLSKEEAEKRASEKRTSKDLLKWLWDVVCCPILQELGFTETPSDDNWPRVWWIPTGILSQLPLHAAGCYDTGLGETVLDRVMSSYASSIRTLQYSRRNSAKPASNSALLVAMNETPDLERDATLPFASDEIKILEELCPSLGMKPVTPPRNKTNILEQLKECKIFHFAGHGKTSLEPSLSQLLLEDWKASPLTVEVLRDSRLQDNPPFLAYLSACSTSATDIPFLADEGVHLVSTLQLAGFRHVVGTIWEVHDKYCVEVAKVLYETLAKEGMTDIAVCRGLHRAQRALRDRHMEEGESRNARRLHKKTKGSLDNTYWIPYVHFGC